MTRPNPETWEARKAALADIDRYLTEGYISDEVAERGRNIIDRLLAADTAVPSINPDLDDDGLSIVWSDHDKYIGVYLYPLSGLWYSCNVGEPYSGTVNYDLLPVDALRSSIAAFSEWMRKRPTAPERGEECAICNRPIRWSVPDLCWNHGGFTPGAPAGSRPPCRSPYGVPRRELMEAMRIFYPDPDSRPWSHYPPGILATLRSDS